MSSKSIRSLGALVVSFALVGIVAAVGTRFMPGPWYAALEKPSWTPPNWLFGPAWTVLYVLMAVSAWLVWQAGRDRDRTPALVLYLIQLGLNSLWSWVFFGLNRIGMALADLTLLWVTVLLTAVLFGRTRRSAGWMLVPYLMWVTFAGALNFAIWRLNA